MFSLAYLLVFSCLFRVRKLRIKVVDITYEKAENSAIITEMYVTIPKIMEQKKAKKQKKTKKTILILTDCLVDKFVIHFKLKMKNKGLLFVI